MTEPAPPIFELRIEELSLEGFSPGERRALAAALESELARLLAGADAPFLAGADGRSLSIASLDAGVLTRSRGTSPAAIGVEAARAVAASLGALSARTAEAPAVSGAPAAPPGGGTP